MLRKLRQCQCRDPVASQDNEDVVVKSGCFLRRAWNFMFLYATTRLSRLASPETLPNVRDKPKTSQLSKVWSNNMPTVFPASMFCIYFYNSLRVPYVPQRYILSQAGVRVSSVLASKLLPPLPNQELVTVSLHICPTRSCPLLKCFAGRSGILSVDSLGVDHGQRQLVSYLESAGVLSARPSLSPMSPLCFHIDDEVL